jgi:tetratricopeptide (TPR) repeat protein
MTISEEKKKVVAYYSQGRKLYKLMQFAEALKYFSAALKIDPKDGPSNEYVKRCKNYIANPPPEDWDGVYTMDHK